MPLTLIDLAIRGMITGMTFLLVVLICIGPAVRITKFALVLASITFICRTWATLPKELTLDPGLLSILRLITAWEPVTITWFILLIFTDNTRFRWGWLLSAFSLSTSLLILFRTEFRPMVPYLRLHGITHFCAIIVMIIATANDDLSDPRRRIRYGLVLILLIDAIITALAVKIYIHETFSIAAFTRTIMSLFSISLLSIWSLKMNRANWAGETTPPSRNTPNPEKIKAAQIKLIRRIERQMQNQLWRTEGLTVEDLAKEVHAPAHQVRKAINTILGYRNFSSFINQFRVETAKDMLISPDQNTKSIQTIAYDVGFNSIGPFNRAFREVTGDSPTEFRDKFATDALADSEKHH